jgi:ribosomal protein S7
MNTFVETKSIRVRRSKYVVPFSITLSRRVYLITKWLMSSLRKDKKKVEFSTKLVKEIFLVLKNSESEVIKLRDNNNSKALVNRSNLHYRW